MMNQTTELLNAALNYLYNALKNAEANQIDASKDCLASTYFTLINTYVLSKFKYMSMEECIDPKKIENRVLVTTWKDFEAFIFDNGLKCFFDKRILPLNNDFFDADADAYKVNLQIQSKKIFYVIMDFFFDEYYPVCNCNDYVMDAINALEATNLVRLEKENSLAKQLGLSEKLMECTNCHKKTMICDNGAFCLYCHYSREGADAALDYLNWVLDLDELAKLAGSVDTLFNVCEYWDEYYYLVRDYINSNALQKYIHDCPKCNTHSLADNFKEKTMVCFECGYHPQYEEKNYDCDKRSKRKKALTEFEHKLISVK